MYIYFQHGSNSVVQTKIVLTCHTKSSEINPIEMTNGEIYIVVNTGLFNHSKERQHNFEFETINTFKNSIKKINLWKGMMVIN